MKRTFYLSLIASRRRFLLFLSFLIMFGVTASAQTFSIWTPGSEVPANEGNDLQPSVGIEVGFKFKVTQLGTLKAIRFYKYSGNGNGSYTANLWNNGNSFTPGGNLSTATAPSVTGAGWKEIDIPDVVLTPGNAYVISIFSPTGFYSVTNNYFPTAPDQSIPPFIIVANNTDPALVGNGVYKYTATSAFPDATGNTSNYWIDPVFTTTFTLPVSIADFKATTASNNILLNWKTESEGNNDGFEIQRSNNGTDWYAVTFVKGAGQSSTVKNYSYTDRSLAPGLYYYRLKQIDLDGKSKNTAVVTATVSGKGNVSLYQNTPNPFSATTTIRFDLPFAQKVKLSVFDMAGREIKVLTNKVGEAGSHLVTLDAATLSRQLYLVKLQTEDGVLTKTILVQ
jgi:Domain of unknown function (DUF4082)/Secretion system C-terminal sorting domain